MSWKTKKELEASGRDGFKIVFEDEGHVQALKNGHATTSFKGVQPTRRPSAGRARLTLFVAVGKGPLSSGRAAPATRSTTRGRERTRGLFGKARMIDDGAGCREPTCPRRTQAKTPAA